jgi:preprotein translocase subunit SecA
MDYLREGIHLRGFAQIDPLVAYKNEGFEMFTELMNNIWDEFARYVFNVEVEAQPEAQAPGGNGTRWGAAGNSSASSTGSRYSYAGGTAEEQPSALAAAAQAGVPAGVAGAAEFAEESVLEPPPVVETKVLDEHERIGRNDPCWCGSGKKFKKCHGAA